MMNTRQMRLKQILKAISSSITKEDTHVILVRYILTRNDKRNTFHVSITAETEIANQIKPITPPVHQPRHGLHVSIASDSTAV